MNNGTRKNKTKEESSLLGWEDFKLQKTESQIGKKREPRKMK